LSFVSFGGTPPSGFLLAALDLPRMGREIEGLGGRKVSESKANFSSFQGGE
jgi:hypothetical protein